MNACRPWAARPHFTKDAQATRVESFARAALDSHPDSIGCFEAGLTERPMRVEARDAESGRFGG